jgi:hypothetical protein
VPSWSLWIIHIHETSSTSGKKLSFLDYSYSHETEFHTDQEIEPLALFTISLPDMALASQNAISISRKEIELLDNLHSQNARFHIRQEMGVKTFAYETKELWLTYYMYVKLREDWLTSKKMCFCS